MQKICINLVGVVFRGRHKADNKPEAKDNRIQEA